jgi:hypothetical protein
METAEIKIPHTPGPWFQSHLEDKTDGMYYTRVYDHKDIICTLHWYPVDLGDGVTGTRREANAKLIAAAPELLATCKELLKIYHDNNFAWPLPLTNTAVFDRARDNSKSNRITLWKNPLSLHLK